jgi:hypothetical protein
MAKRAIEFHPEAASDYYAALTWYRDRSVKAARKFEAEFVRRWSRFRRLQNVGPSTAAIAADFFFTNFPSRSSTSLANKSYRCRSSHPP